MIYIKGKTKLICLKEEEINEENYFLLKKILKSEKSDINSWIEICLIYHKKNHYKLFLDLVKEGESFFSNDKENEESDTSHNADKKSEKKKRKRKRKRNKENQVKFYFLQLIYNLEKIIHVKSTNKENELKIKTENLMNQIETKKKEIENENKKNCIIYNKKKRNKKINTTNENTNDNETNKVDKDGNSKNEDGQNIDYNNYDFMSYHLIKGIYNINMALYILNKYDGTEECELGTSSFSYIRNNLLKEKGLENSKHEKNDYENPLYYLIESINIFVDLIKKNNYDFIASLYLSFALCLINKFECTINFAAHTIIRIIYFQKFLIHLVKKYKHMYIASSKKKTNSSEKNERKLENVRKLIYLKNLQDITKKIKAILKYIIGICYMKKKQFSIASFCFTASIKEDDSYSSAYFTNSLLLLRNYLNKISSSYYAWNSQNETLSKHPAKINTIRTISYFGNTEMEADWNRTMNKGYNPEIEIRGRKETCKLEKNRIVERNKNMQSFLSLKDLAKSIGNKNLYNFRENDIVHHEITKNLKKTHVKEIININLFYYYSYLNKGIRKFGKNIENALNEETNCVLNKHDIFELDETIDLEISNNGNNLMKKEYASVFLNVNMMPMYLDLCEFWLYTGNIKGITLLKLIKAQINFNYIKKRDLSKYYYLVGIYYHTLQNMKKAVKYYNKSYQIYKNFLNRYYFTLCCIYLRRNDEAKRHLAFMLSKWNNAYVLKLYCYFYVQIANQYLNYNIIQEIGSAEDQDIIAERNKVETVKINDKNETIKQGTHQMVLNKFTKHNSKEEIEVVLKKLNKIMEILKANETIFDNDLDFKLLKIKIFELLITKNDEVNLRPYFNTLKEMHQITNFFQNGKHVKSSIPYELMNNYIIAMYFCDSKQKSLELIKLLKKEILWKLKFFIQIYNDLTTKEKEKVFSDSNENRETVNNISTSHSFNKDKDEKEENEKKEKEEEKEEEEGGEQEEDEDEEENKKESEEHDIQEDIKNEIFLHNDNNSEGNKCNYKRRKDVPVFPNKRRKNIEKMMNQIANENIKDYNKDIIIENVNTDNGRNGCEEMKNKTVNEILTMMDNFRRLRIYHIRKNLIEGKGVKTIILQNATKQKYKSIINYLKKVYITVSFNSFVLLELLGYREEAVSNYKLFTKVYVNYEFAFIRLAQIYIKDKKYAKAKVIIDEGLSHNPLSLNLHLLKSFLHTKGKHYEYSIYLLTKLKKNKLWRNDPLLNTYMITTKYLNLKTCKNDAKSNYLTNEILSGINASFLLKNSNFYLENIMSILLSEHSKYELAYEAFQLLIDAHDKFSFYYFTALRNIITHMTNHLIQNTHLLQNKLFINKLNVFFNLWKKNGTDDKHIYLIYCHYLHKTKQYDAAIDLLCNLYGKWPHDFQILNFLLICIDASVSKCLNSEYVELNTIFRIKSLMEYSFRIIVSLLYWRHFTITSKQVGSGENRYYYEEGNCLIEVKKNKVDNMASRKYMIATYRKFEEKIKPYIESSLPIMLQKKKKSQMKRIMLQKKILEEKRRKKMTSEMKNKMEGNNLMKGDIIKDLKDLSIQTKEGNAQIISSLQTEIDTKTINIKNINNKNENSAYTENLPLNNKNDLLKKIETGNVEQKTTLTTFQNVQDNNSSSSSELFEEKG